MSAILLYHSKLTVVHSVTKMVVIAELKIWKIDDSHAYPEGIKYSLFCIDRNWGFVIVGMDNYKHINDQLIDDFWNEVQKKGFYL